MSQVHRRTGVSEFRLLLTVATVAVVGLGSGVARAQESCAEGDWFCEPSPAPPPSAPPPEPPAGEPEPAPLPDSPFNDDRRPPHMAFEPHGFRPPPHRRRPLLRWGVDAHVFGALLQTQSGSDTSMGGLGTGLRYRIYPEFALEGDLELGFGTDYNGFDRTEASLLFHAIGILNPRSIVRAYVFGGFGASTARVSGTSRNADIAPAWSKRHQDYGYFGFDIGAGAELRISPRVGVHVDLLGFVRDRTDADRGSAPEFTDPKTGRTTNSSGGGLLRVGAMFYF
jgi:hypothetical protein